MQAPGHVLIEWNLLHVSLVPDLLGFGAAANRRSVQQVARETDVSRPMVWRWQQRFAKEGPDGLLRDKTRRGRGCR
jgi:hypothetical protein